MQLLRNLLFPFSILYDGITSARNWAFDTALLSQKKFETPIIAVGNLSTGGTGKTPMIEWLIEHFKDKKIAIISRGYGRKTTGFIELNNSHNADQVGDEPLQIKLKYGNKIISAVSEKRVDGINQLLKKHQIDLILLDDAFQHRYVKASHYILLTSYDKPYFKDYLLPTGNLRESRKGADRAHSIILTKCPAHLSLSKQRDLVKMINPLPHQQVFFSTIDYDTYIKKEGVEIEIAQLDFKKVTALTGIANPEPFIRFLKKRFEVDHMEYGDHHRFRESELQKIKQQEIVITTEKDFMRLAQWNLPNVYFLRMETKFIGDSPNL